MTYRPHIPEVMTLPYAQYCLYTYECPAICNVQYNYNLLSGIIFYVNGLILIGSTNNRNLNQVYPLHIYIPLDPKMSLDESSLSRDLPFAFRCRASRSRFLCGCKLDHVLARSCGKSCDHSPNSNRGPTRTGGGRLRLRVWAGVLGCPA